MKQTDFLFTKMVGAGNDFIVANVSNKNLLDALKQKFAGLSLAEISQKLCSRHEGIGADGMVYILDLKPKSGANFKWDFYNADGSPAEMCGNAARCAALYAIRNQIADSQHSFETLAGQVEANVISEDEIHVSLSSQQHSLEKRVDAFADLEVDYDYVNSGVPHAVIEVDGDEDIQDLKSLAQTIRNAHQFQPQGTNVTYVKVEGKNLLDCFSFERGVEDFTRACGTGAVAAAISYLSRVNNDPTIEKIIEVKMPGGKLKVDLSGASPVLIGPARFVAEFRLFDF